MRAQLWGAENCPGTTRELAFLLGAELCLAWAYRDSFAPLLWMAVKPTAAVLEHPHEPVAHEGVNARGAVAG